MSIWGDIFGDSEMRTENMLSGQQQQAMDQMGTQANRLQDMASGLKPADVTDPSFQRRLSDYSQDLRAVTNRQMGDAMHSNKIHSSANMLKRAGIRQQSDMSLGNMEQQNLQQQLRNQEQANINNEYLRRGYFNQANALRSGMVNKRAINNLVEEKPGILNNVLGLGTTAVNLFKAF
jgi:hypothetical protein